MPSQIRKIYVSPRQRAKRTLELLELSKDIPVEETELISEWDYGKSVHRVQWLSRHVADERSYEGLTSHAINEKVNGSWNVFRDGCPGGDNEHTIKARVDELIGKIRTIHAEAQASGSKSDVLVVAHGHILRSFAARWINAPVLMGTRLAYGAGGAVCVIPLLIKALSG